MPPINRPNHLELIAPRTREPVQPPRVLAHIRKGALASSEELLAHLFSATDDLFYDLSKRATSNSEQNLYFEAMREIRIKREGIANLYLRGLSDGFTRLLDSQRPGDTPVQARSEYATLALVEGDDLEVDLARANMVARTREIFKEELYELTTRLDHLLLQVPVTEEHNPLDPAHLTAVFVNATQEKLEAGIKAKLILFKLFEKHVLKQLGHIYADANQILVDAGILPKVPKHLDGRVVHGGAAPPEATAASGPSLSAATPAAPTFSMTLDALSILLNAMRPQTGYSVLPGFNLYNYAANPGPVMGTPELAALLTQTQSALDQQLANLRRPQNLLGTVIGELLAMGNPAAPQSLEGDDETALNLVSAFFDQLLRENAVPVPVQSLLCRMQIPILKVALRDRSFFTEPEHPARLLINAMTEASLGLDETKSIERDPLFRKLTEVVQTLNRQHRNSDQIFIELLTELRDAMVKEARKAAVVEQRTHQAEAGKSRIKQARAAAQAALYEQLKDLALPNPVKEFLTQHWLQVMVITHLREGGDSTEWLACQHAVTDLIWCSQVHADTRSQQRRERLLPELLERIETALSTAIDSRDVRTGIVASLAATLQSAAPSSPRPSASPLTEAEREALGRGPSDPKAWSEMSAVERQQAQYEELANSFYEQSVQMAEGTWLEYRDDNGRMMHCKLTSKGDPEAYVFVNRMGFKVLERSRKQFAYDLQAGTAKLVDMQPLFDRVMQRVVNKINTEPTEE